MTRHRDHIADILRKIHGWLSWVRKIVREVTLITAMLAIPVALFSQQADISRLIINFIKLLRI
jgi:hypothetical protein